MRDPILGDILAMDEMIDRKVEQISRERGIKDPVEARMKFIAEQSRKTEKEIIDLLAQKRDEFIDARIRAKEKAAHNFLVSQGWDGVDTEKAKEKADKFICEEHPDGTITFREKTEEEIASEELLPCPCCGNYNRRLEYSDMGIRVWYVRCECGLLIGGKTKEGVIKKWNRRPSPWHTGTPTEEGWYLIAFHPWGRKENGICYKGLIWKDGHWFDPATEYKTEPYLVAWRKIESYTPEQVTGKLQASEQQTPSKHQANRKSSIW